jgi:hypothetical protein
VFSSIDRILKHLSDKCKFSTLNRAADVPEDDENDFYPSRLLLSATILIDQALHTGVPTDYNLISRNDDAVRSHPMISEEGPTHDWFMSGKATPGK